MDKRWIVLAAVLCAFGIIVDTYFFPMYTVALKNTYYKAILDVFTYHPQEQSIWLP
jgi:hypothetical protein